MANFLVAADGPSVWEKDELDADGKPVLDAAGLPKKTTYIFPVWPTAAWIPVLAALLQKRIDVLGKYLTQRKVPPNEAAYYLMQEECRVPDANDAHAYSLTLEGMDRVLRDSLVRGGVSAPEATTVVNAIPTKRKYKMALNVAGVYEQKEPAKGVKDTASNNDTKGFGEQGQTPPDEPASLGGGSQPAPANPPTSPSP